ncbi:LPXTG_cell wall anchor domain-containing protein [Hexamita inflata]|uniref:LPXTG cell wall anchor domain-containing protein n=1 Tax=Hexamita inflata TaxID=28002 RepID=A0AA86RI64_9EUKA|nr:LPXTG cell wall anchor domain-containing protein [Hexamita inflata]
MIKYDQFNNYNNYVSEGMFGLKQTFTNQIIQSKDYELNEQIQSLEYNYCEDIAVNRLPTSIKELIIIAGNIQNFEDIVLLFQLQKLILILNDQNRYYIDVIGQLIQLKELQVCNHEINRTLFLQNLQNLNILELGNNKISDLNPLAQLTNLKELALWDNQITDISPLKLLINLKYLNLCGNMITNISHLSNLSNLEQLYLWNNKIQDIYHLKHLIKLQCLSLEENLVIDISTIKFLTELQELCLSDNQIVDISALANLQFLSDLSIGKNYIQDFSQVEHFKNIDNYFIDQQKIPTKDQVLLSTKIQYIVSLNEMIEDIRFKKQSIKKSLQRNFVKQRQLIGNCQSIRLSFSEKVRDHFESLEHLYSVEQ